MGGWSKRLLPELADVLTQTQQGIMYLASVPDAFRSPALPAWGCSDDGVYGFPAWKLGPVQDRAPHPEPGRSNRRTSTG